MRIMVFTPYGDRLEPETVEAVLGLDYEGQTTAVFQWAQPTGDSKRDILRQYQTGREAFLGGGYDALLVIESDIIPPPDTLKKLIALDTDCAYGVYMFRHGNPIINIAHRYEGQAANRGEPLDLRPEILAEAIEQVQYHCTGGGLGCVLIKRHVLEAIEFRNGNGGHCDTHFNNDVHRLGFDMWADMSVICGHKRPDGEILYPDYARSRVN